jgi:Na+/H+ antiporter NhaA
MSLIETLYIISTLGIFVISIVAIKLALFAFKDLTTFWLSDLNAKEMSFFKFYGAVFSSNLFIENVGFNESKNKLFKALRLVVYLAVFIMAVRNGLLQFIVSPTGI